MEGGQDDSVREHDGVGYAMTREVAAPLGPYVRFPVRISTHLSIAGNLCIAPNGFPYHGHSEPSGQTPLTASNRLPAKDPKPSLCKQPGISLITDLDSSTPLRCAQNDRWWGLRNDSCGCGVAVEGGQDDSVREHDGLTGSYSKGLRRREPRSGAWRPYLNPYIFRSNDRIYSSPASSSPKEDICREESSSSWVSDTSCPS